MISIVTDVWYHFFGSVSGTWDDINMRVTARMISADGYIATILYDCTLNREVRFDAKYLRDIGSI